MNIVEVENYKLSNKAINKVTIYRVIAPTEIVSSQDRGIRQASHA